MHRLFHSLVFSSFLALESVGCSLSHDRSDEPMSGDGGGGVRPDSGPVGFDAGRRRDASSPDAGVRDAGQPDTGTADAGATDAGTTDAGRADGGDVRLCEPGWPTTKAVFCEEMAGVIVCCDSSGCCVEDGR